MIISILENVLSTHSLIFDLSFRKGFPKEEDGLLESQVRRSVGQTMSLKKGRVQHFLPNKLFTVVVLTDVDLLLLTFVVKVWRLFLLGISLPASLEDLPLHRLRPKLESRQSEGSVI